MTQFPRFVAVVALILATVPGFAQERVHIESAKVGLPPGPFATTRDDTGAAAYVAKPNTWAPVYLNLEVVREVKKKAAIVIQGKDADDLSYTVTVPLPDLTSAVPGTKIQAVELPYIPYVRPNSKGDEIVIRIAVPDSGDPSYWSNLGEPKRLTYLGIRDAGKYVVLSLGTKLPGFDLPSPQGGDKGNNQPAERLLRGGRVETAAILDVGMMPDQWFGYEAADLVVLTTGAIEPTFLKQLFDDANYKNRLDALLEWVRRGGKLVVSVGSNAQIVGQYPLFQSLLPLAVNMQQPTTPVKEISLDWLTGSSPKRLSVMQPRAGTFPLATLVPKGTPIRQLVPAPDRLDSPRLVAQSAFGLGRITVVGFDLDRSPFIDFPERATFWDQIVKESGAAKASVPAPQQKNQYSYNSDVEDGIATAVRDRIDTFEGVPVISFGWVAVFIVLYTLLIGPIEYIVLKKVFKRLELTWVTFPVIVLTVSAIAYFAAYSLKGNDLKVNKTDVIDIDPASGRVYGRTWFTVFSPRIESYTVTLTAGPGWGGPGPHPAPLIDWLGGSKGGKSSFFSRRYQYHADPDTRTLADGLQGVPIQVWSTKAFSADWAVVTDKEKPLVESKLVHPPADRSKVGGSFTLNLPLTELKDVRLIYAGKAYKYDAPIVPGTTVTVLLDRDKEDPEWMTAMGYQSAGRANPSGGQQSYTGLSVSSTLFHEAGVTGPDAGNLQNASLRRLDQSWRLATDNRNEVIVVGRVPQVTKPAEELMTDPLSPSPTVLWLKGLPGDGPRVPTPGTMQQETFVRIYVPIPPVK